MAQRYHAALADKDASPEDDDDDDDSAEVITVQVPPYFGAGGMVPIKVVRGSAAHEALTTGYKKAYEEAAGHVRRPSCVGEMRAMGEGHTFAMDGEDRAGHEFHSTLAKVNTNSRVEVKPEAVEGFKVLAAKHLDAEWTGQPGEQRLVPNPFTLKASPKTTANDKADAKEKARLQRCEMAATAVNDHHREGSGAPLRMSFDKYSKVCGEPLFGGLPKPLALWSAGYVLFSNNWHFPHATPDDAVFGRPATEKKRRDEEGDPMINGQQKKKKRAGARAGAQQGDAEALLRVAVKAFDACMQHLKTFAAWGGARGEGGEDAAASSSLRQRSLQVGASHYLAVLESWSCNLPDGGSGMALCPLQSSLTAFRAELSVGLRWQRMRVDEVFSAAERETEQASFAMVAERVLVTFDAVFGEFGV